MARKVSKKSVLTNHTASSVKTVTAASAKTTESQAAKSPKASAQKAEKKAEPKAAVKKTAAKPAAKKTAAKKTASKRSNYKSEVFIQFSGIEITSTDLTERVKEIWTKEMGKLVRDLKEIKVYVNADESMAYYVINNDVNGKFAL